MALAGVEAEVAQAQRAEDALRRGCGGSTAVTKPLGCTLERPVCGDASATFAAVSVPPSPTQGARPGPNRPRGLARVDRRQLRLAVVALCGLGLVALILLVGAYRSVSAGAQDRVFQQASQAPVHTVVIVPGARVFADGSLSDVVDDRVACALALYRDGRVRRILVSGDHGRTNYDEVGAMGAAMVREGVPPQDVFLDHAGFRTLDTMHRAAAVFGVQDAIICTQRFHLPRSIYLARHFGIDAVGVVADRQLYSAALYNELREALARASAVLDIFLGRGARMLGPKIPIRGSGLPTHDRPLKRSTS